MDDKVKTEQEIMESIDPGAGPGDDMPDDVRKAAEAVSAGNVEG